MATVLGLLLRDPATGGTAAVLAGYGLALAWAQRRVRAGDAERAVVMICAGLLAGDLLVALFEPAMLPALGSAPMLAVVVALPYLGRRGLGRLIAFCIAQAMAVMLLGEYVRLVPEPAAWLASILRILSLGMVLAMALFLLWQFSSRLTETLAQTLAARSELEAQHERLSVTLDSIGDGVIVTDEQARITRLNPVAEALTGWSQADAAGRPFAAVFQIISEETRGCAADPAAKALDSGEIVELASHTALIARDGSERSIADSAAPIRDGAGRIHGAVVVFRDQTQARRIAARVAFLADHDALTGLINRRRFGEELDRALDHAGRTNSGGAVLLCDLDGFKAVNDSLGHRAGDELLCEVGSLLAGALRPGDVLARLGGDEFAALLPDSDAAGALCVAERLVDELRHARFAARGQPVRITASIGGALFPEHSADRDELLIHADLAMYRVKEHGRDGVSLEPPDARTRRELADTRTWEERIRSALDGDALLLYLQPILPLRTGRDAAPRFEALLRMRGVDGEIIAPGAFLHIAERSGLIRAIDRWVVCRAVAMLAAAEAAGQPLQLAVNLSGKAFSDAELLVEIRTVIQRSGADPRHLLFEVTESAAIADLQRAREFVLSLQELGCSFAVDDFGAGFSSFYYLKHLPVDLIKLDGSFVRNLPHDTADQHLVKAMVEVARGLGKRTIAEFVGDEETLALLRDFGVDYAQGYHVGRPRALAETLPAVAAELERANVTRLPAQPLHLPDERVA